MLKDLPERVFPIRLARSGSTLAGRLAVHRMARLADMLHGARSRASIDLRFGFDGTGIACVRGNIEAELDLLCQRCLNPMSILVKREMTLAIVESEDEAARVDSSYEPLLVGEEAVVLANLVEDELILSLPDFPRHPAGECVMPPGADAVQDTDPEPDENPFAVLQNLKGDEIP